MKGSTRRIIGFAGVVALTVFVGSVMLLTGATEDARRTAREDGGVREIRLIARNMTYYVAGDDTPNPTLRLKRGERIRLGLENQDPGMDHDVAIGAWKVGTRLLTGSGADTIEFRVPDTPGREEYSCTPHARMMRGTIEIE